MRRLRVTTAGESHGPAEVCIIEGLPAGVAVTTEAIERDLTRRRQGYGRGGRMAIETDNVRILAGVRHGLTLGTPVGLLIENRDHASWRPAMQPEVPASDDTWETVTIPRPGHADLSGLAKYGHDDVRSVLERASARETVTRVAAGAVAREVLRQVGVTVAGRVVSVGTVTDPTPVDLLQPQSINWERVEASSVGCMDEAAEAEIIAAVDEARAAGESLGGVFEIWAWGLVPGVGGYASALERLGGRLMGALGSIPAIKAVEVGVGFGVAALPGSTVHDPILPGVNASESACVVRGSNRAGGIEGGMTNGSPIVVRAAMKPIPTLTRPLPSVDLATRAAVWAHKERSDIMAVPAARVVGEAVVALELASAYLEKFGGDCLDDLRTSLTAYEARLEKAGVWCRTSH